MYILIKDKKNYSLVSDNLKKIMQTYYHYYHLITVYLSYINYNSMGWNSF